MRLLVGTDGSASASMAVDLVAGLAWPAGTHILVVEAVETGPALFGGPWPALAMVQVERVEAQVRLIAGHDVEEARRRLEGPGRRVEAAVLSGRPATMLVERAEQHRADVIVLGRRGHGAIESMLLGSVSAEVIDSASVPVLVARGEGIERVVLAWDGSACALRAADLLLQWPIFAGSSVRVVSVADIDVPWPAGFSAGSPELMSVYAEAAESARVRHDELAREMTARLRSGGLTASPERRDGDAATEILRVAESIDAQLIVMGTHGRTGLARFVLGSVARNVAEHAKGSVLVVRDGGQGG